MLFVMLVNLRGVKEAGAAFAIPTYFFLAMMISMVGLGFLRHVAGSLGSVPTPAAGGGACGVSGHPISPVHAFSSGTTALTGVEAISNGIPAFTEPRSRNAGITLIWMAVILAMLFLGITFLAGQVHAIPSEEETVISQLARTAFDGRGLLYHGIIAATTIILIMATNTSFAGFPRLSALLAADGFLPRQLTYRGSRLVYSRASSPWP